MKAASAHSGTAIQPVAGGTMAASGTALPVSLPALGMAIIDVY
jgi:hypothetical protein